MTIAMKIFAVFAVFAVFAAGASARVLSDDDQCATAADKEKCCNTKINWSYTPDRESADWCTNYMPCGKFANTTGAQRVCCELKIIHNNLKVGDDAEFCKKFFSSSSCSIVVSNQLDCCHNRLVYNGTTNGWSYDDLEGWCKKTYTCKQLFPGDDKITGFRTCCDARKGTPDAWPEEPQCAS